ncbi:hypothetical protein [Kitasatospora purpeofusca]|uniref:hypothetical protein n=1 Tax=Kitasatospora purpeofusca TaxID=67352 RepID=UPI0035DCCEAE
MHQPPGPVRLAPDSRWRPHPGEPDRPLTTVEAAEADLLRAYVADLRASGHTVERYRIDSPDGTVDFVDALDTTTATLVAARAGTAHPAVLHYTIGELLDVRSRFDPLPAMVLLLPAPPSPNTAGLLHSIGITPAWPDPAQPSGFAHGAPA